LSNIDISIEALGPEIVAAYKKSGMDRGLRGAASIEWSFRANPEPFAVARAQGRIVGVSSYILTRMQFGAGVDATTGTAVQAVDSFVVGDQRGKGIFTRLARAYDEYATRSGLDLVWGFPNDNAAPAWFNKLSWHPHGQVPFLIKPLRAGYILRKLRLGFDFPLGFPSDQGLAPVTDIGAWADVLWDNVSDTIACGTVRDRAYLSHRLLEPPHAASYRIIADTSAEDPSIVATTEADKHGGRIGYVMEALGGPRLKEILNSELGRMRANGTEMALAWAFPSSPNYRVLRGAGFIPLPEMLRPIRVWFGTAPKSAAAADANTTSNWYISYLDSDTV
jgi:GNAT superfamily N-acetyltransferase